MSNVSDAFDRMKKLKGEEGADYFISESGKQLYKLGIISRAEGKNWTAKQKDAFLAEYQDLQKNWSKYFKEGITIDGNEVDNFEDFQKLSKEDKTKFLEKANSTIATSEVAKRLGVSMDTLTNSTLTELFGNKSKKIPGILKIGKNGKYELSENMAAILGNKDFKKALSDLGISDSKSGLKLLVNEMNGVSSPLQETNNILEKILQAVKTDNKKIHKKY